MFNKKRKAPSVKIPAKVLRREAEKAAKKMLMAEKKREKMKEMRVKAKSQAKLRVQKKKDTEETWNSFFDEHLQREVWGGLWIMLALAMFALFFSQAELSQKASHFFQVVFGVGKWILPLFFISFGVSCFRKNIFFPPQRVIAFIIFFAACLGMINLFAPAELSQEWAPKYGGAMGFASEFFFRHYFGTAIASILLVAILWLSGTVAFGIRISSFFLSNEEKEEKESKSFKVENNIKSKSTNAVKSSKEDKAVPADPKRHFENELKIIDSQTANQTSKKVIVKEIDLEKEDDLTAAKNMDLSRHFEPPSLDILKENDSTIVVDEKALRKKAEKIREKFEQFGIEVSMKSVHVGPTVTQFTLEPAPGVKLTKITSLKNDMALTLAAENVRIEAPIRGKSLVGIEIPNKDRSIVGMREILQSSPWDDMGSALKLAVGRDVSGKPVVIDLAKMPHLLIAGKTGSGKSVAMNAFLSSLIWHNSPDKLRMILVDPKRVELKPYDRLPHLLTPVIVEPEKCVSALAWAVAEMNRRYRQLSDTGVRNLEDYNKKFPEKKEPYIVIVIDELADLMMVAGKDVEAAICRIAQMARAVGMHLMIATQRPSVDVVTGLIKANLPSRISFKVSSGIDSRTIIDGIGAEDLLGFGDMLYLDGNSGSLSRIQGLYISTEEVERLTNHIKLQFPEMSTNDEITNQSIDGMAKGGVLTAGREDSVADADLDVKFNEAVSVVLETKKASASFLQRRLEIGYARAARILDQMESKGIIGPSRGAKAREIYGMQE